MKWVDIYMIILINFINLMEISLGEYISLFWDLGGQNILRTIWKKYYQECHGFIYVVDITDDIRLEEAANSFSILYKLLKFLYFPIN